MLTDDIIEQLYIHELHPKYSIFGRIVFFTMAIALINFSIYIALFGDYLQAVVQTIVAIGFIVEGKSKRGFSQEFLTELVSKLTDININIANIKDTKYRAKVMKQFNYYIDKLVYRPNSVSRYELNTLLNNILLHIAEEEEAIRQGYHFTTEEEFEEQRQAEEEAFQRRKAEYREERRKRQQEEQQRHQQEANKNNKKNIVNYFDKCYTLDDLNRRKKELLKHYHPDNHKNLLEKEQCEQISKEINEAFVIAKNNILNDFNY